MFVDLAEASDQTFNSPSDVKELLAFIKQFTINAYLKLASKYNFAFIYIVNTKVDFFSLEYSIHYHVSKKFS